MKLVFVAIVATLTLVGKSTAGAACAPDAVRVGPLCVDKYEASIWQIPSANRALVKKVVAGKATLADLTAGGAEQIGCNFSPWNASAAYPATFPANGNWTAPLYAASVPGVVPSTCLTWFQAEQACAISGKRLLTNQEWQRAAAGTPEDSSCNTSGTAPQTSGAASHCVSSWGVFDMVGNVDEYVADWVAGTTACPGWSGGFSADLNCFAGAAVGDTPNALIRGGSWESKGPGVFSVWGFSPAFQPNADVGARCAR
jgi:formylglycine-generating enzyme required for sulfatase activity